MNDDVTQSHATMISCPACAGVVRAESGTHDHLEFVCTVGHAFSLEDLYKAKEEQLEAAQWSLVALFKHIQMIGGMFLDSASSRKVFTVEDLRHRLKQVAEHITLIERTIHETRWPSSSRRTASLVRQGQDE